MYDEVKRVDLNWAGKMDANEDYMYAFERLSWIDSYLQECDEILGEVGLGIDFTSRSEEIEVLSEERDVLWNYIAQLQSYNEANIDNPLYKSFVNGATQTMSTIRLENYTVDNNLGLTVEYFVNGSGTGPVTIEKGKLTFEDFIGTLDGKADGNFLYTQFANGSIEDFAIIFEQQYQSMLESGMLGEDKEMTQEEFLTQFYHQGEFNHKVDKPFASFVSSVLDITIIKPVIEACTGEEWFTGNQLTDMERGLKAVFAMVDLFTLGMGSVGTEITELGAKDALVFLGKTVTIDLASNAAVYGIGELGQALDWPAPITIMLSLATGITVSCIGNKLLFKNAEGVVIRETELSDAQVNKIGEMLEGKSGRKGTVWDNITSTADNMPATEIPATFKIDLDENINYVNPETGTNTLWTNSNATKHMGEYVSRFGDESWSIGIRSQAMLESYSASLNEAMKTIDINKPGRYFGTYGNWELGINTETGTVYHARMLN